MKYNEDVLIQEILEYISGTYKEHYVSADDGDDFQLVDLWNAHGTAISSCCDTAMKYPLRYGRKNGYNEKDLFKAIHYLLLALHFTRKLKVKQEDKKTGTLLCEANNFININHFTPFVDKTSLWPITLSDMKDGVTGSTIPFDPSAPSSFTTETPKGKISTSIIPPYMIDDIKNGEIGGVSSDPTVPLPSSGEVGSCWCGASDCIRGED